MKAVRLHETTGPRALRVETVPDLKPAAGEILVRISRAAFNRRDVFITQGKYPGIELPKTIGSDGAGTVAALGEGVTSPAVGTRVVIDPQLGWVEDGVTLNKTGQILGMPHDGTFAEYVTVPSGNVHAAPEGLSDDELAALPLAGLTAYRAVFTRGRLTKDDTVLITGVGSGVQTFVLAYVKHVGAKAIVTSGSEAKLERARALGADVAIDYNADPNWHKAVRKATGGEGPTLTIDSSGGETFAKCLDIAAFGGRVVMYGGTNGDATIRPFSIFWKHLDVLGTSMGGPSDFAAMLALFGGGLRPVIDKVFAMDDVAAAAERLLAHEQFGKVVLAIAP